MNPWGLLIIAFGVILIIVGWKGAYRNAWQFLTGNATSGSGSSNTPQTAPLPGTPGGQQNITDAPGGPFHL